MMHGPEIMFFFPVAIAGAIPGNDAVKNAEADFAALHDAYVARYEPLMLEFRTAEWEADTTGSNTAFDRKKAAEKAIVALHGDREMFARLKTLKESGQVTDPLHRRQLDVMYRTFLPGQADPSLLKKIIDLEAEVQKAFNTHRSRVGDKVLSENDVRGILRTTSDTAQAERAWKGYMALGAKVADELRQLVELRNQSARQLGFTDYYAMALALQEIDQAELFKLFDELDELTRGPFAKVKRKIDTAMAARFGISAPKLRPWHFGDLFFQEAPMNSEVDLDAMFKDADLIGLSKKYFASFGLPCEGIIASSDLYERPGKNPHAYCTDIDRKGDIRILCNLKPNIYWADTLLHELGHAVYDKYIRRDSPFLLRSASHGITTEGVALMFGGMVKREDWLVKVRGLDPAEAARVGRAARAALRTEKLVFSRWAQVMVRFERGMYADPDRNLGKLWWDLKKRYQLLNGPETVDRPDYAAKAHILSTPVYYHNYLMGELFAAQVQRYIARKVLGLGRADATSFYDEPRAGEYLRDRLFAPGNMYSWNELTKRATGEPLTAKYFMELFVEN